MNWGSPWLPGHVVSSNQGKRVKADETIRGDRVLAKGPSRKGLCRSDHCRLRKDGSIRNTGVRRLSAPRLSEWLSSRRELSR